MEREKGKDRNRAKIRDAAEAIIRAEGIDKLNMRRLAQDAGVSIATPYNLFGSKADVLVSILVEKQMDFHSPPAEQEGKPALELLFEAHDAIRQFFASDEEFFRAVQREIMVAEDTAPSHAGLQQATFVIRGYIDQAKRRGELRSDTDVDELSHHLATIMVAVQGMWASSFFSNEESMAHIKRSWKGVLEAYKPASKVG
ncbi:MAG: TetR/AcrR family transcriptional regulator [Pseudomonadota bacterium]